jgi:hypothetical protein
MTKQHNPNFNWEFDPWATEDLRCHIHRYAMKKKIGACEVIEACAAIVAATLAADFCPCCQGEIIKDFAKVIAKEAAEMAREDMH